MATRKAVLFITNQDFGQTNVVCAVAYELLQGNELDVHIASWALFEPRVIALSEQVQNENPDIPIRPIIFHTLPTGSMFDVWLKHGGRGFANIPHPPGLNSVGWFREVAPPIIAPWDREEHIELFEACAELAKKIKPGFILLDPHVAPAHDMCRTLNWKHAILSPCTLAGGIIPEQPWLSGFWKYPALGTGYPYPVPWKLILPNLYCLLSVISLLWCPHIKRIDAARKAHGLRGRLPSLSPLDKDVQYISPSIPEIELPLVFPSNAHLVGPILLAAPSVTESDPELLSWLEKRPTVLASLGTLFQAGPGTVKELCMGFRILLDARPDIQVLWKLKPIESHKQEDEDIVNEILGKELTDGRVRIEEWLKAEPLAILQSGHIVCEVNHGGANSYFEAAWAGIPQVVLPHWYDTFDYATRAEYLGIGVYGNTIVGHKAEFDFQHYISPTMVEAKEFGGALLKVVGKEKGDVVADAMRKRASELGKLCRKSGGRATAAKMITEFALTD